VLFLFWAMLGPSQMAAVLGGVAVTLLAITAWVTVFGAFTLIVQSRALIAPFRWLRLRAAPVLTLGLIVPFAVQLVVSSLAPDRALHAVHVPNAEELAQSSLAADAVADGPGSDPAARTPEEQLEVLLADDDCALTGYGEVPVRPVYLIAAEGGGIRAAYWTASALATLDGCAARSGFVSSGISGGSVGLAVASTAEAVGDEDPAAFDASASTELRELDADDRRAAKIVALAKATAGPEVVSTVILGLAVGDAFAAGSGVHMPNYLPVGVSDDHGWRWRDRAALAESLWEQAAPALATPFSDRIDPLTGMLMLSSTDVISKCRLLVDQAPITPLAASDDGETSSCDRAGGMPSMVGFRELPASGGSDSTSACLSSLDWSTATMLSARFAIVTPTGGLPAEPPCNDADGAQFVDGGYVEPTSLAALADTAPRLMSMIADVNADRGEQEPWLLPILLYLRNTQGYDLAEDAAHAESEPLVPITGGAAKNNLMAEDAWIQRITMAMPGACPDDAAARTCRAALDRLISDDGSLPGGAVVVAPASTPAVVPPLGWALSEMSQARFTSAMKAAAGCAGPADDAARFGEGRVNEASGDVEATETVTTRHGRYAGLERFAEVIGFDPCDRVDAQELSRTAPAPDGEGGTDPEPTSG